MDNIKENDYYVTCPLCKGEGYSKEEIETMAYEKAYKDYFENPDDDKYDYEPPEEYAEEKYDDYITYFANRYPHCSKSTWRDRTGFFHPQVFPGYGEISEQLIPQEIGCHYICDTKWTYQYHALLDQ